MPTATASVMPGKPINILMVVYSNYPADPRVRREAEALVADGMHMEVVCLRGEGELRTETVAGIGVHRLPASRTRGGKLRYILEYLMFFLAALLKVTLLSLRRRYRIVHVHNMPDFLVFTALLPRLLGARVILDLHDPMPEVFETKYGIQPGSRMHKLLVFIERISIGFAHRIITPNIAFLNCFASRGNPREKITIVMNSPDEKIFAPELAQVATPRLAGDAGGKEFRVMFHGGVYERHGLETALRAIQQLAPRLPRLRFEVYGDGDYVEEFMGLVETLGLQEIVRYHGRVSLEVIARAVADCDLGLIPNKNTPFTRINMPTRIFEYLALNRPLIAPRTPGVLDYFDEQSLFFFEPDNAADLARVIERAMSDPVLSAETLARGREIYARHTWQREQQTLQRTVRQLLKLDASPVQEPTASPEPTTAREADSC